MRITMHSRALHPLKRTLKLGVAFLFLFSCFSTAQATSGFARQTGMSCSACHVQSYGPWLTPLGQKFKLDGYVAGKERSKLLDYFKPFSLEVVGSLTNTQKNNDPGAYYSNPLGQSKPNNNLVNDWTALYYTGRVTDNVGAYLQMNVNPQASYSLSLAMADIRAADHLNWNGNEITYGVTVNNAPSMSDFWMTTSAWMYPYTSSTMSIKPIATTWTNALMGGANTVGATAYTMINNHLYLEAGAYTSQSHNMAQGLGVWGGAQSTNPMSGLIDGAAPYWRVFWQQNVGPHQIMFGTSGLTGNVIPFYTRGSGTDSYTEFNVDSNYSYMLDDDNMFMAMARFTRDDMRMNASNALGASSNPSNYLNSLMMMGMWTYQQTYNLTLGWNLTSGSSDFNLYNGAGAYAGDGIPTNSVTGSPNTNAFLFQADYVPFGKGTTEIEKFVNLRLSMQYWAYTQFNGSYTNYDGNGRSPEANNTFYVSGNMMF